MPNKKAVRVKESRSKPVKSTQRRARALPVDNAPIARQTNPVAHDAPPAIAQMPPIDSIVADPPAVRLFWAWYRAGVDTARLSFDIHTACVRHLMQASPASWLGSHA